MPVTEPIDCAYIMDPNDPDDDGGASVHWSFYMTYHADEDVVAVVQRHDGKDEIRSRVLAFKIERDAHRQHVVINLLWATDMTSDAPYAWDLMLASMTAPQPRRETVKGFYGKQGSKMVLLDLESGEREASVIVGEALSSAAWISNDKGSFFIVTGGSDGRDAVLTAMAYPPTTHPAPIGPLMTPTPSFDSSPTPGPHKDHGKAGLFGLSLIYTLLLGAGATILVIAVLAGVLVHVRTQRRRKRDRLLQERADAEAALLHEEQMAANAYSAM